MQKRTYKTVQRISGAPKIYRKWAEWGVGDIVIGRYVEAVQDRFTQKNCPVIEVEEAFFKDAKYANDAKGKNLVLNHTGMLGKAFEKISTGELVQIEYQGVSTIESGPYAGKESHITKVDIVVADDGASNEDDDAL